MGYFAFFLVWGLCTLFGGIIGFLLGWPLALFIANAVKDI